LQVLPPAAAQESFTAGYATNFSVIEQQIYLAPAQATEVMASDAPVVITTIAIHNTFIFLRLCL
jgi:hypothetical protein